MTPTPSPDADHAMGELLEALIENRHLDITHAHITKLIDGTGWVWDACWYLRAGNTAALDYRRTEGARKPMAELVKVAMKARTEGEAHVRERDNADGADLPTEAHQ